MRVTLSSLSGRELLSLDAEPAWQLPELLAQVPPQPEEPILCRRGIWLGGEELCGEKTLEELGVADGARLTLLFSRRKAVLAAAEDGKLRLFAKDEEGEALWTAEAMRGLVSVAAAPDGSLVLAAGGRVAQVFNANGLLRTFSGHTKWLSAALFSPETGAEVLTASGDSTARLWGTASGEVLRTFDHGSPLSSAAFSPSGTEVATSSRTAGSKIWRAATGECLLSISHEEAALRVAFTHCGQELAVLLENSGRAARLRFWRCADGAATRGLPLSASFSFALAPDGLRLAADGAGNYADYGAAWIWCLDAEEPQTGLRGHTKEVSAVAFSPDGDEVLTASDDGTARLWCAASGQCLRTFGPQLGAVKAVAFC